MTTQSGIINTRFVLAVQDLQKSVEFYKNKLGFKSGWFDDNWHFLHRDECTIMLGECADDRSAFEINNHSYFGYFDVQNIDILFSEFKSQKIEILSPLKDKPWGQREFSIRTIDGHRIMFGENISR